MKIHHYVDALVEVEPTQEKLGQVVRHGAVGLLRPVVWSLC